MKTLKELTKTVGEETIDEGDPRNRGYDDPFSPNYRPNMDHDAVNRPKNQTAQGGTRYDARNKDGDEKFKDRDAETGGRKAKANVGRPVGDYGSYKLKTTKMAPEELAKTKVALSAKVVDSKMQNWKDKADFASVTEVTGVTFHRLIFGVPAIHLPSWVDCSMRRPA